MVELAAWDGLVQGRNDTFNGLNVQAFLSQSGGSWSGPFKVAADDHNEYFVKALETCPAGQHRTSLATELVVSRVGSLIGAPVCETSLIRIPGNLAGWEAKPGVPVREGLAHASRALRHCDEAGRPHLTSRNQDSNTWRHVGIYALYDWCMGHDPQWLYDIDADRTIYSHDHGLYLPPVGSGELKRDALIATVHDAHILPEPPAGVLPAAIEAVCDALLSVTRANLVAVMSAVPAHWPVSDNTLEALGWFLEDRAAEVAERLRALI